MLLPRSSSLTSALSTLSLAQKTRPVILDAACARLRPTSSPTTISVRHASHGTAGRANGPKNGPGKRLGAKKTGDEYVIPGNIIFRQRGTLWHPGENVGIGRDHTIFALESGYVKYYRNPRIDPKKRYIGIVFDKTQTLPTPLNAARRRRLNMVAAPRNDVPLVVGNGSESEGAAVEDMPIETTGQIPVSQTPAAAATISKAAAKELKRRTASALPSPASLSMMPGNHYSYRESNYSLGRAAERAGVDVKQFERGDRFLAWRKKGARKARNAERRSLGKKKGSQRAGKRVQA